MVANGNSPSLAALFESPNLLTGPVVSPAHGPIPQSVPASWQCRERTSCLLKAALAAPTAPVSSLSGLAIRDPCFGQNEPIGHLATQTALLLRVLHREALMSAFHPFRTLA